MLGYLGGEAPVLRRRGEKFPAFFVVFSIVERGVYGYAQEDFEMVEGVVNIQISIISRGIGLYL